LTYRRLFAVGVGMMGLSPSDFDDMTLAEFDTAEQGYMRRIESDYRTAMNVQRWGSYVVLAALTDLKGREPTEVLPLPWDEKPRWRRAAGRLTKRELSQMQKEALESVNRLEAWQKR
jgi:hypothetical protein